MPPTPPNPSRKRGRAVPPAEPVPVIIGPLPEASPAYHAAVAADSRRFVVNPGLTEFIRPMRPGEFPGDWPPGTRVLVRRIDNRIARAFITPDEGGD